MNPLCGECGFSGQLDRALKTFRERRTCGRCAIQSKHVNPRARLLGGLSVAGGKTAFAVLAAVRIPEIRPLLGMH